MLALDPDRRRRRLASFAAYLPEQGVCTHPLGCHRPRISDRDCFEAILFRLVTGCSWDVAGRLGKGSETTLRRRRDEWVAAGAFAHLVEEAICAFDKVIGLDFSDVSIDGSLHKAPGRRRRDRTEPDRPRQDRVEMVTRHRHQRRAHRLGDRRRQPQRLDPARPHPRRHRPAAACSATSRPSGSTVAMTHGVTRTRLVERGIDDAVIAKRRKRGSAEGPKHQPMGLRWPVERTNSWLSNFGQLRRNTDRFNAHRLAQFALAVALIITVKLVKWAKRWDSMAVA